MLDVLVPGTGRQYLDGDRLDLSGPVVLTIPNVLDRDECAATIRRMEELGPEAAPISTGAGFVMRPEVRNNRRVVFDDVALAQLVFDRVKHALPATLCEMRIKSANERFRAYRYDVGHRFAPHYDGAFCRSDRERSLLTLMVYLNEDFRGGTTRFHDYEVDVVPRAGLALAFQHHVLHEGCVVSDGTKYALRTDVMYED